ncbi:MAG: mycofactocin system FadH/OYE family oxidoreductase 2 [Candidatus Lambdaproteobacteria bacterium]|nr:mycofactocin system FadH/OYE family oxidoreductase 2 [Candidatus Lambdaproteobacteria bacterium]
MSQYRHLFRPIRLGPVTVRNRVVFSAHLTNLAEHNLPSERLIQYYRERARGGCGLIITEEQSVHPSDFAYEKLIHAFDPAVVPHYRRMTQAVKREGAALFCQINHNGLQGFSHFNDEPLWGPSPVPDGLFREVPRTLGEPELAALIAGFARVGTHARAGGFDGVEVQASHSSLLRQFLSPRTNRRRDRWGGSLENRLRLTVCCLEALREAIGPALALGIRLCTDELEEGGLGLPEVVEAAARLDALGVLDFFNTSIGTTARLWMVEGPMSVPAGYQSAHTAAIREAVRVPVIGVGRINDPVLADRLLHEGVCDLIGVVRGQIADAEWAAKSAEERTADVRKCIACNQYCIGLMGLNRPLSCIQNPANGEEAALGEESYRPAGRLKRVLVIGGGPAGMEAAIVAARHGHRTTLCERSDRLGGAVNALARVPQRLEYGDLIRNKTGELKRSGAELVLGREADAAWVLAQRPDAVIVATGQQEGRLLHIPGMSGPRVATPLELLAAGRSPAAGSPAGHALILDEIGFHQATSLAEWLIEGGWRVSFVTAAFYAGQDLGATLDLDHWHRRLAGKPLDLYPGHILIDAQADPVLLDLYRSRQVTLTGVERIVPVAHGHSRDGMYRALRGQVEELYRAGDALAPKDVGEAILDGHRAGRRVAGLDLAWQ